MQSFFKKKVPLYFRRVGRGGQEILLFAFKYFPISKSFIPNFCDTNYDFSSKIT